jgi:hypothetical protein
MNSSDDVRIQNRGPATSPSMTYKEALLGLEPQKDKLTSWALLQGVQQ